MAGHSGYLKTYQRAKRYFYWDGMKKDIKKWARECDTCQATKYETLPPAELLQPLHIPQQAWMDIFMDFIEGLPKSKGYFVIFVVVDCFIKYGQVFLGTVFKLHSFPKTIVSDRDPLFLSSFWNGLFTLQGTALLLTPALPIILKVMGKLKL